MVNLVVVLHSEAVALLMFGPKRKPDRLVEDHREATLYNHQFYSSSAELHLPLRQTVQVFFHNRLLCSDLKKKKKKKLTLQNDSAVLKMSPQSLPEVTLVKVLLNRPDINPNKWAAVMDFELLSLVT